jgi:hypothetical protein
VIVPLAAISTSSLVADNFAALPVSRVTDTGRFRFELARTATGPLANFKGTFSSIGSMVRYCSARWMIKSPLVLPV